MSSPMPRFRGRKKFRTKTDVDDHVLALFHNVEPGKKRNIKGYNIAQLYYAVGDYNSALHYISTYVSARPYNENAHKLLGQAYEGCGEKKKALEAYKTSVQLLIYQPTVVFKVCELLLETSPDLSPDVAQNWLELAEEFQVDHPIIFSMKKHVLASKGDGQSLTTDDLELLIKRSEENETLLYSNRAKLSRYERTKIHFGVGEVQILKHNETGKVRLMVRCERTHKVWVTQTIGPKDRIDAYRNSDIWSWRMDDFVKMRSTVGFHLVFNTLDDAKRFGKELTKARDLSKDAQWQPKFKEFYKSFHQVVVPFKPDPLLSNEGGTVQ